MCICGIVLQPSSAIINHYQPSLALIINWVMRRTLCGHLFSPWRHRRSVFQHPHRSCWANSQVKKSQRENMINMSIWFYRYLFLSTLRQSTMARWHLKTPEAVVHVSKSSTAKIRDISIGSRKHMEVSWNGGTPKSSILIWFSHKKTIQGIPISGTPHITTIPLKQIIGISFNITIIPTKSNMKQQVCKYPYHPTFHRWFISWKIPLRLGWWLGGTPMT